MMLGYGPKKNKAPDHLMVKKIDNGFVIEACCVDEPTAEYVKKISKIPAVLERVFNMRGKKSKEDYDKMNRKESTKKNDKGEIEVKIEMTE